MKRIVLPLLAAALIGLGALADHLFAAPGSAPVLASPPAASPANVTISSPSSSVSASTVNSALEHAYAVASASVVYVDNVGVGTGSGIIYDTKGDIVTNNHVVSGQTQLQVTLNNGKTYAAQVLGTDPADDLAVIKINASGLTPAAFAGSNGYQVAETVLAIGSPLGLQQSVTSGLISGVNRVEQEPNGSYLPNAIQTSAPINPGNSGGALVDLNGSVVGMPTLEQTSSGNGASAQDVGFAIPSTRITYVANQIIATGKVANTGRAFLGISPADATGSAGNGLGGGFFGGGFGQGGGNTTSVTGALVQQVASSGPAARAGVQQGDVITGANGVTISDAQDLLTVLAHQKPGNTIALKLNRNGSTMTVHVTLGQLPAAG